MIEVPLKHSCGFEKDPNTDCCKYQIAIIMRGGERHDGI
jgi:hypothetical protein